MPVNLCLYDMRMFQAFVVRGYQCPIRLFVRFRCPNSKQCSEACYRRIVEQRLKKKMCTPIIPPKRTSIVDIHVYTFGEWISFFIVMTDHCCHACHCHCRHCCHCHMVLVLVVDIVCVFALVVAAQVIAAGCCCCCYCSSHCR